MKVIIEGHFSVNRFEENIKEDIQQYDIKGALNSNSSYKNYLLVNETSEELETKNIEVFI